MKRWLGFAVVLAVALLIARAEENALTREQVLAALAVTDEQLPNVDAPQPPQAAPAEKNDVLLVLQKMASDRPDPLLIGTLLRYQLAYLSPDNPLPARVMGAVFLEQPDAFVAVYQKLPAAGRVILGPYLEFGFQKAVEGRNTSSPKVLAARKKLDALQASLMNARSRDDAH